MEISVVIPTKDRPLDLDQCINSILSQTFPPEEIIIIDDGELSENFIEKIKNKIKEKEIICKYIRKKIPGLLISRNLGASKSENSIVLFLDDDVILNKDYIEILKKLGKTSKRAKNWGYRWYY